MQEETSRPHGQASASASAEEVPDTSSGPMLVELAFLAGQFVCLECGQRLKAGHRANIRAKAREDRSKHANRVADKLGVAISSLTSQHIRFHTEEGDSSGRGKRGMQSFDAEAIATARKHRQRGLKKQEGGRHFTSVSDRFTRDSQFALRLLENGVDRERALQLDYLCNAKLPAPPRSREQIIGGLGSLSEVGPHRGDDKMNTTARLCFLSDEPGGPRQGRAHRPQDAPNLHRLAGSFRARHQVCQGLVSKQEDGAVSSHLFQRHPLV